MTAAAPPQMTSSSFATVAAAADHDEFYRRLPLYDTGAPGRPSAVDFVTSSSPTMTALPVARFDMVTHGDIWTPDVVQRVATLVPLMVASLLGNVITVVVLTCSKYRKLNSRINIFIINLAVGDLAVCCFTMTTEVRCA